MNQRTSVITSFGGIQGKMMITESDVLTFSASQPRCLISRLPAMPVFPSCSLTSTITRLCRSLTLAWIALNQAWAVAESLLLRITVCLASGEWISSCLEKQRKKIQKFPVDITLSRPPSQRWTYYFPFTCHSFFFYLKRLHHSFTYRWILIKCPDTELCIRGTAAQLGNHVN